MCSMFLDLNQKQSQSLKQMQRMMTSPQMKQALGVMQAPVLELLAMIEAEMEENPILDYLEEKEELESQEKEQAPEEELKFDDNDLDILKKLDEEFRDHFMESESYSVKRTADEDQRKAYLEQSLPSRETLFEHLMKQAEQTFQTESELFIAELIIGNLDENGFFLSQIDEIPETQNYSIEQIFSVLNEIQTFDPAGVGATSLREALLIQLRRKGQSESMAYKVVDKHWDDLLHNRVPQIAKGLRTTKEFVREVMTQEITKLDFHPGSTFSHQAIHYITPDANIDDDLNVTISNDSIPNLRFNSRYIRMLNDETLQKDVKEYIRNKVVSAKWLLKNIDQRHETLEKVVTSIANIQKDYLQNPEGKLVPLMMKTVAEEVDVHESTVARAVANKYVNTPRGIIALRDFFTNSYTTADGDDISSNTVREVLKKIIDGENKMRPLSDESLSKMLQKKGVSCARRTVAKYRSELNIGNTQQRREY